MIQIETLHKAFGKQSVLKGVNLQIQAGEKLCIVGGSGSGKSVLIKLIFGLIEPDRGTVQIEGQNVWKFSPEQWHTFYGNVGMVFQSAALFDSLTVRENVGIRMIESGNAGGKEIQQKVAQALEAVGLEASIMDKIPAELSGGMKKRVGIARAIIHQPQYLVYDEPTTGLDPINSAIIDELIQGLSQDPDRTTIIITHDLQTVKKVADKVAMLFEGKILFHDPAEKFFHSELPPIKAFLAREKG
ncbi:MAG: ATP-binding cassette domain-containing protein [Bacteroidota bacterium]